MKKADLVNELTKILTTKKEAAEVIETIFDSIKSALRSDNKVTISGFGSFYVKLHHARKVRRLQDGVEMIIPPRKVIKFKPSKKIII